MRTLGKVAWNQRATALAGMKKISARVEAEGRDHLTEAEDAEFRKLKEIVSKADADIERHGLNAEHERALPTMTDWNAATATEDYELRGYASIAGAPAGVQMLSPKAKLTDVFRPGPDGKLSIGKMIRGMATGRWEGAESEKLAMRENANSTGGVMVPTGLWNSVVDLARARSVYIAAGAVTIPMTTETLVVPRAASDFTFACKGEGQAWTESDASFDSVTLTAKTYGALGRISNELLADGGDLASQAIETSLIRGLAASIDAATLNGSSGGMTGLLNSPTIVAAQTGSVGAIAWEDLITAATAIRVQNYEPNSYIISPTIASDLDALTSGDGVNSAKTWLGAPPAVEGVRRLTTTAIADTDIIMGDFTQTCIGIRQEAVIEVSREANDAFAKNDTLIRIVWRGDALPLRPTAFHRLAGITT